MKRRSKVWDHFVAIKDENGFVVAAKCNYCFIDYKAGSKTNGTSALHNHLLTCVNNPNKAGAHQSLLNLQSEGVNKGTGSITAWKYDENEIRNAVAYMVIVDELPFKFVEGKAFHRVMSKACPRFKCPSRSTVTRDCYSLYVDERVKLKAFLKTNCQRVCLTTDTWTSIQRINYMCVTAHFIDNEWNLHKKILNFMTVSSHRGDYLGKALETCILDWGLKNVFSLTVDNASSNDTAVSFLKKRIMNWGGSIADCKFLHMRCIAHVINLVVSEGLKDINQLVKRVRDAVRYVRNSPARLKKFKECVDYEGIECKRSLCLDVATRWNSTYLMLSTAAIFEKAFDRFREQDTNFVGDLGNSGVPTSNDWACARKFSDLLKHFYDMTLRISGSKYITSNSFFGEVSDLCCILSDWISSEDVEVQNIAISMKLKFDKYWGDPEKMNKLIFWANVFDPRDKLEYMEYSLDVMYGVDMGKRLFRSVKDELVALFNEYKLKYQPNNEASASSSSSGGSLSITSSGSACDNSSIHKPSAVLKSRYKKQKMELGGGIRRQSELEVYLSESIVEEAENLDVLKWWKLNADRFPVLSKMARDILSVPISTVASESAFSAGGRVLDAFRSSLTPRIVEALICTQDWLRGEQPPCVEEQFEELENIEKDLPNLGIGQSTMY